MFSIKKIPRGVKASFAFFIGSIITKGISYLTTPLFTRLLSSSEYGRVSVFLSWLQVFGIVAMFCLSYGVFNNGMIEYPEKRDEYSFSMLMLSNAITLCFGILFLLIYPLIQPYIGLDIPLILLMIAIYFFQPAYNFWLARQRFELKYKWSLVWSVLSAILSPLVAIICLLLIPASNRLYLRIFGAEVPLITIYFVFYIYLGIKCKGKIDRSYWKEALIFNLPLIPHYLSTYLLNSADKFMISYLVSDSSAAFYSVAYSVAAIGSIIWTSINGSLVPFTYEKCRDKNYNAIDKVVTPILTIFGVGCIVIIMMAPELIGFMATSEYMEAIYVVPPVVGGIFFQVQYSIYANIVYYYKKPKYIMLGSVISVIVNIILNYFCIIKWGYIAAGYTTLICYLLQAIIDYFAMKKVVSERIYNMKYICVLSTAVIIVSIFSGIAYSFPIIRVCILLLVILLMLAFRRRILELLKVIKNK